MYARIKTPFIFHCEEDWLFTDKSFIEKSMAILNNNPKLLQVHLRAQNDVNGHPVEKHCDDFDLLSLHYLGRWNGFSFNPGLRRLCDYNLLDQYVSIGHEIDLSEKYRDLGFRAAILKTKHVEHIGWGRHVDDVK
jgi:hypothetical protein